MSVSAGLPQLPRQLLRALSQNLSDSREATRSLYYYSGLGWYVEHAALNASVASGLPASKSALDERQLLLGRPPTSPPSPNRPPSRPRAWGASNTMPYRQLPPPQRWIRAHSGSKGGRCSRFEAAPRSVRRGSALCKARAYASVLQPLAKTQRGAVRIWPLRQPAPTS